MGYAFEVVRRHTQLLSILQDNGEFGSDFFMGAMRAETERYSEEALALLTDSRVFSLC